MVIQIILKEIFQQLEVFLGCKVVEKHFTLNKKMSGIDQKASIDANELSNLKSELVEAWKSLGKIEKKINKRIMKID